MHTRGTPVQHARLHRCAGTMSCFSSSFTRHSRFLRARQTAAQGPVPWETRNKEESSSDLEVVLFKIVSNQIQDQLSRGYGHGCDQSTGPQLPECISSIPLA